IGVVAERTVWYSRGGIRGVASEIGATKAATRWFLGPASFDPAVDSVVVLNPTTTAARVSVTLERDGRGAFAPGRLQHVKVKAGTRLKLSLARWTTGPVVAVVSSDKPVVAERFSYSRAARDVCALMGSPLAPTGR
ncbi:MAG: DUF5719 family protein, partial [Actinomycetota bacterium]|nr:DUF5719 family protein [Actinomycetota bacterium]